MCHRVARRIFEHMHIRRTMRSEVTLPDGSKTYPAEGLLPATICVEELAFDATTETAGSVADDGIKASKRLFSMDSGDTVPNVSTAPSSQAVSGTSHEAQLNFGVHRKGVLVAFDHRNKTILEGQGPTPSTCGIPSYSTPPRPCNNIARKSRFTAQGTIRLLLQPGLPPRKRPLKSI